MYYRSDENAECFSYIAAAMATSKSSLGVVRVNHDDVIKWKHFPRYWPFVRGIHRSPLNSPHKGQWRGPLMFSLICVWINRWVNNREAGDWRRHRAHYDVIVMMKAVARRATNMVYAAIFILTLLGVIFCDPFSVWFSTQVRTVPGSGSA